MQKRFVTDKIIDGIIGKPFTPGRWISKKAEETDITVVKVTYGGGMGGINKDFYCKAIDIDDFLHIKPNSFIKVTDLESDKEIVLNTNYIVSAHNDYKLATAKYHSDNSSYSGDWNIQRVIKRNIEVELRDDFRG